MRKLRIARGGTALGTLTEPSRETTWPALYKRLQRSDETGDKASVGFWVGGHFNAPARLADNLISRSVVVLDVDYLPGWALDPDLFDKSYPETAFAVHSTWSHTKERPRLRVAIPLSRDVSRDEYEPLARVLAKMLDIDAVDRASYKYNQLMYWPSHTAGADTFFHGIGDTGALANPDTLLGSLKDWTDPECWPYREADRAETATVRVAKNPHEAPGVIGVFNRLFTVQHAIHEFALPYEPGSNDTRYTYVHGQGRDGARIYDHADGPENCFLYSDHDTDPARGNNTVWDLVRIHKFSHLDKGQPDIGIGKAESQKQMQAFALSIPEVSRVLAGEEGFEVEVDEGGEVKQRTRLTYDTFKSELAGLDHEMTDEERKALIPRVAAAKLDPSDLSILAGEIVAAHGAPRPSKQAVLDSIKAKGRALAGGGGTLEGAMDIEVEFVKSFVADHYAGGVHIRRYAGQFWGFRKGRWSVIDDDRMYGQLASYFARLRVEKPEEAMALVAAVGEAKTSSLSNATVKLLAGLVADWYPDPDPLGLLKRRPAVINCLNGEIHFSPDGSYEFTEHHPELFLTEQVEVNWDPEARCPEWDRFLAMLFDESLESDEMIRHLEELGGYLIQPTRWLKTWVLLQGPANAGKTTIGKAFENLLGGASAERSLGAYAGQNSHAEAGLVGKLMLLDEDFKAGELLPDGFIKKISEEKQLTANPKGSSEFNFMCRALPVILSNSWPATRDLSDALLVRALVWHLKRPIREEERDDIRAERMLTEDMPGILVRFVAGFSRLRARGQWDVPDECQRARDLWQSESNSVNRFLKDCTQHAPGKSVKGPDLFDAYRRWASVEGLLRPLGRNHFYDAVSNTGVRRIRTKADRNSFREVELVYDFDEEFD